MAYLCILFTYFLMTPLLFRIGLVTILLLDALVVRRDLKKSATQKSPLLLPTRFEKGPPKRSNSSFRFSWVYRYFLCIEPWIVGRSYSLVSVRPYFDITRDKYIFPSSIMSLKLGGLIRFILHRLQRWREGREKWIKSIILLITIYRHKNIIIMMPLLPYFVIVSQVYSYILQHAIITLTSSIHTTYSNKPDHG